MFDVTLLHLLGDQNIRLPFRLRFVGVPALVCDWPAVPIRPKRTVKELPARHISQVSGRAADEFEMSN